MRKLIISSSDSYYFQVNAGFSTFRAIARGARGRVEDKLKERGPFTIFMPASEIHLEFKGTVHQLSSRVMEIRLDERNSYKWVAHMLELPNFVK